MASAGPGPEGGAQERLRKAHCRAGGGEGGPQAVSKPGAAEAAVGPKAAAAAAGGGDTDAPEGATQAGGEVRPPNEGACGAEAAGQGAGGADTAPPEDLSHTQGPQDGGPGAAAVAKAEPKAPKRSKPRGGGGGGGEKKPRVKGG